MSSEDRHVPEPGELVYAPKPSWAPAVFAFAIALAVCGIFAEGFALRGWVYSIIGLVVALFALRGMVKDAASSYFKLPRKQKTRGAVLPVETISVPRD